MNPNDAPVSDSLIAGLESQEYLFEGEQTQVGISLLQLHHMPPDVGEQ